MKQLIVPIAILVALIAFFAIIDRKEFSRHDDVQTVQGESLASNRKPTGSVPEPKTVTETRSAVDTQSVTETKQKTDAKSAETKPIAETKSAETKPVAKTLPIEGKLAPAAIPVVTAEETEKLNEEAMVFAENNAKRMDFSKRGMELVHEDKMDTYASISIAASFDEIFRKNGVIKKRSDFLTRKIPKSWEIDYNTLRGNCDFGETDKGFEIHSPDGTLTINTSPKQILNTTTGISVELTGKTTETKVKFGIEELGLFRSGKVYIGEMSGIFNKECFNYEISAFEHFDTVRLFLEITGDVTIHMLRIYQKEIKNSTCLEGQIIERSSLPDPKTSDYPNCRYTIHFDGNAIFSGKPLPKEVVLVVEGFKNYEIIKTESIKPGDKVECSLIPYESLPVSEQSTQQSDELDLYLLERYYVLNIHKIAKFRENAAIPSSGIFFSDGELYTSIFEKKINPPLSQSIISSQNNAIQHDLAYMNSILRKCDKTYIQQMNNAFSEAWNREKAKDPLGYNRIEIDGNKYVWRNINNSFWALPENYTFLKEPDILSSETLDCFTSLKHALESNGVQLIVSLVPDLYTLSSRVINKDFSNVPDLQTATYVKQLSEIDVETIYASDQIIKNYNRYPFAFFYPSNGHPSDLTQDCLSDILVERLERHNIIPDLNPELFSKKMVPNHYGYVFPSNCDNGMNLDGTIYPYTMFEYNGKPLKRNPNGSIIVFGNSYMQRPTQDCCAIPMLLSKKMNISNDVYLIGGLGPFTDGLNQILSRPEFFLKNKKALILHVGTGHIKSINRASAMFNIQRADQERLLLNHKKMVGSFSLQSNISDLSHFNGDFWDNLKTKTLFELENNERHIITIKNDETTSTNKTKPILCLIPCCTVENGVLTIEVNGVSRPVFRCRMTAKFYNLLFELPADTKEITIKIKGRPGTPFAIKDIQIWQ